MQSFCGDINRGLRMPEGGETVFRGPITKGIICNRGHPALRTTICYTRAALKGMLCWDKWHR